MSRTCKNDHWFISSILKTSYVKVSPISELIILNKNEVFCKTYLLLKSCVAKFRAYWPSSLSTIEPIDHQAYQPSSYWLLNISTIEPIKDCAYWPSSLSTIEPIDHQSYQQSSLVTIEPIRPISHQDNFCHF